jgi:serine/threonine protein kinase
MVSTLAPGQFQITILEELGRGGLGRVDRVRILNTANSGLPVGTEWAIKRLDDRWNRVPEARERFEREIRTLSKMSHPNIIGLLGASLPGFERYYLMPLYRDTVRKMMILRPKPLFGVSDPALGLEVRLKKPRPAIHVHRNMYRF